MGQRAALDAILYQVIADGGWDRLPSQFPDYGFVRSTYKRWLRLGRFDGIWLILVEQYSRLDGINSHSCLQVPQQMRCAANP